MNAENTLQSCSAALLLAALLIAPPALGESSAEALNADDKEEVGVELSAPSEIAPGDEGAVVPAAVLPDPQAGPGPEAAVVAGIGASTPAQRLQAAHAARDAGDLDTAVEIYRSLIPHPAPAIESAAMGSLAQALSWKDNYEESIDLYDRWRESYPEAHRVATLERARVLGWARRYGEALREIDVLLERYPWDRSVRHLEGQVAGWGGRYDRAVGAFRDILKGAPDDLEARLGVAKVLSWAGRFPEATREYRNLLEDHPDHTPALVGISYNLAWEGRPHHAERWLEEVPAEDREELEVRLAEAALSWHLQEWGESRRRLATIIRDNPGAPDALDLWRAQTAEVGPYGRPYASIVEAEDGMLHQRAGVSAAVPVGWPSWVFADLWGEHLEYLGEEADARGFRLGLGYSQHRRWNARAWGGVRQAQGFDAGGITGGLSGTRLFRTNVGLVGAVESDFLFVTPQAMARDVRVTSVTLGGFKADSPNFRMEATVSRAWFDGDGIDQARDQVTASVRRYLTGVKIVRLDVGLRGRYFTFDQTFPEAGYFNPDDFAEILVTLAATWRRGERLGLIFDGAVGQQRIAGHGWHDAWAVGSEVLYQLTRRFDLAGHLTYTRLNIATGAYSDRTASIGLKVHVGSVPD